LTTALNLEIDFVPRLAIVLNFVMNVGPFASDFPDFPDFPLFPPFPDFSGLIGFSALGPVLCSLFFGGFSNWKKTCAPTADGVTVP
jgi:hypothetical protein